MCCALVHTSLLEVGSLVAVWWVIVPLEVGSLVAVWWVIAPLEVGSLVAVGGSLHH